MLSTEGVAVIRAPGRSDFNGEPKDAETQQVLVLVTRGDACIVDERGAVMFLSRKRAKDIISGLNLSIQSFGIGLGSIRTVRSTVT